MKKYLYEINPIDDENIADWVISNETKEETLAWYCKDCGVDLEGFKIRMLTDKEVEEFEIFDHNTIYDLESPEVEERIQKGELNESGHELIAKGKEIFEKNYAAIEIVATTEYY